MKYYIKQTLTMNPDHSVHWGISPHSKIPPPSFLPSLPLNLQTVQDPLFRQPPPPPKLKSDFSVNPQNIKVFHT